MTIIAIASYRPKTGQEQAFLDLLRQHIPTLRAEGLVTDRQAYTMRARDGTIVEVFEWLSREAKEQAHENAAVTGIWNRFFELADMVGLDTLEEAGKAFAAFEAVDLGLAGAAEGE